VKGRYLSTEGLPALRYLSCTARNYLTTLVGHCPVRDISGFLGVLGRVFLYLAKHGVDSVGDQGLLVDWKTKLNLRGFGDYIHLQEN
jgi:hypothetical protein